MELNREQKPQFLPRRTRYCLGADLGQAADFTALAVIEHCHGVMDTGSDFERHISMTAHLQTKAERYRVVHLERLPLGTPYGAIVQHVKQLLAREPLCGNENQRPAELAIDAGGVGRGIADFFCRSWPQADLCDDHRRL